MRRRRSIQSAAATLLAAATACAGLALAPTVAHADDTVSADIARQAAELERSLVDDYKASNHETDLGAGGGIQLLSNSTIVTIRQNSVTADIRLDAQRNAIAVVTGVSDGAKHMDVPTEITLDSTTTAKCDNKAAAPVARDSHGNGVVPVVRVGDGKAIKGDPETVTIPSSVDVANAAFRRKKGLKRVNLSFNTKLDIFAFAETPNLEFVDFPEDRGHQDGRNDQLTLADAAFYKAGADAFVSYGLDIWADQGQTEELPRHSQYAFGTDVIKLQFEGSNIIMREHERPQGAITRGPWNVDGTVRLDPGPGETGRRELAFNTIAGSTRPPLITDYRAMNSEVNVTRQTLGVNADQILIGNLIIEIRRDHGGSPVNGRVYPVVTAFRDDGSHTMTVPATFNYGNSTFDNIRVGDGTPLAVTTWRHDITPKISTVVISPTVQVADQAFRGNADLEDLTIAENTVCHNLSFAQTPNLKTIRFPADLVRTDQDGEPIETELTDIREGAFYQAGTNERSQRNYIDIWTDATTVPKEDGFMKSPVWMYPMELSVSNYKFWGSHCFEGSNITVRAFLKSSYPQDPSPKADTMHVAWQYQG